MPNERRAIFITGAASGIGRATALLFASRGWFVGGFDANEDGLKSLATELGENGMTRQLDVVDRVSFGSSAEDFAIRSGGRMDILFNNAGVGLGGGPFEKARFEDVVKAVQINLIGVMAGIHACAELLKATPNSLCFNTCSASALFGMPNIAVYSAAKAGVRALTEALSIEFAAHGIRVADALPGLVATPLIASAAQSRHEGPFRVIPALEIAETVWSAYRSDRIHWYVPEDLEQLAIDAVVDPASVRQAIADKTGPYAWLKR